MIRVWAQWALKGLSEVFVPSSVNVDTEKIHGFLGALIVSLKPALVYLCVFLRVIVQVLLVMFRWLLKLTNS